MLDFLIQREEILTAWLCADFLIQREEILTTWLCADFQVQKERKAVKRKVLPLELKTGKASYSVEHKGQVGHM